MPKKFSQEHVASAFAERGFKLLGEYKKSSEPVQCVCPKGHLIKVNFSNFSRGHGCGKCRDVETGNRQRRTLDSVREEFKGY